MANTIINDTPTHPFRFTEGKGKLGKIALKIFTDFTFKSNLIGIQSTP